MGYRNFNATARISDHPSGWLALTFDYDAALVAGLKMTLPAQQRRWLAGERVWAFDPAGEPAVLTLLARYGYDVERGVGSTATVGSAEEDRSIRVRYLGNARSRGNGVITASGMGENGEWDYRFTWAALREWFDITTSPLDAPTLYAMLGIGPDATASEIKDAYRAMIKAWHPDVSKRADAAEVTAALTNAYNVLKDDTKRRKYDFGARVAQGGNKAAGTQQNEIVWVPPDHARCGIVDVTGTQQFGVFVVTKIRDWSDIHNASGQRMTARWDTASKTVINGWQ